MAGSDHNFDLFPLLHAFDQFQVGVAGLHSMGQGTNRLGVAAVRSKARRALKVQFRAGSNDQVIVIQAQRLLLFAFALFYQHVLFARVGMHLRHRSLHETHMLTPIDRLQRDGGFLRLHVSNPHPHPGGDEAKVRETVDYRNFVLFTEIMS